MHLRCPHCHNPIGLAKLKPGEEILCTACGSTFRVDTDTPSTKTNDAGQALGRFLLLYVVGQGAFGIVFKARDPKLECIVAIKVPQRRALARLLSFRVSTRLIKKHLTALRRPV